MTDAFGAVGDGVTDDTAEIQNAFNEAGLKTVLMRPQDIEKELLKNFKKFFKELQKENEQVGPSVLTLASCLLAVGEVLATVLLKPKP